MDGGQVVCKMSLLDGRGVVCVLNWYGWRWGGLCADLAWSWGGLSGDLAWMEVRWSVY